ncbi:MAG: L-ribulose-5-phosphate 4-epimerase AraD [Mycoplasmatales bacterium]|nr:L-ribulose-5-phosphate 4-epimerase AraD [Mycoplasmatales bacterium]
MSKFKELKKRVYDANIKLKKFNLVIHTWGNVSELSKDGKYYAIKPSGVSYESMTPEDIVVMDLNGKIVEGKLNPSSDEPTHTWIYKNFKDVKAIAHTHSQYGVAWASTGQSIPCYSSTHADNFYGPIMCTRELTDDEINNNYELNTGKVITESFKKENKDPKSSPAVLVKSHGPFAWSYKSSDDVVDLTLTLEEIAKMSYFSRMIDADIKPAKQYLQDKHYYRKHGKNAYYGQKKN